MTWEATDALSHIVEIKTQVRDAAAVAAACQRLGLPPPATCTVKLFSGSETGLAVELPGWQYPVVCDLHSAIGYVAPRVRLENRHLDVFAERDRKLAAARKLRQQKRRPTPGAAARERSPAPGTTPPMPRLDFAAVRAAVTLRDVLQLLGFQSRATHGSQQRGACPLHGATTATANYFSVNLELQVFHCFKCGRAGNQLDLWAYATRQTPDEAALDLCRRLSIAIPVLSQNRGGTRRKPFTHLLKSTRWIA